MLDQITVLLDGSSLSQRVLPHTRTLAHAFDADVTLLHVLEPQNKLTHDPALLPYPCLLIQIKKKLALIVTNSRLES